MDKQLRDEHLQLLNEDKKSLLKYGTSGFRDNAKYLKFVAWRLGLYIGYQSRNTKLKQGVMITASHNKIIDNGFKIIAPKGGMLTIEQEKAVEIFYQQEQIQQIETIYDTGIVYVGRDTRPSSQELSNIILKGIQATGAIGIDLGIVTTPQCSFLVLANNLGLIENIEVNQQFFIDYFCSIFLQLVKQPIPGTLVIDCAEGVGGKWIDQFIFKLKDILQIKKINFGEEGHLLNENCGSEFVQKCKSKPKNFIYDPSYRYASLDGDADRLVYYFCQDDNVKIVEGDRFAILFAKYIKSELSKQPQINISIGVIQTAYANSASTKYIKDNIGVEVKYEPTGVKYLHRAAHNYDIGIYFEANGHGAVIFKEHVLDILKQSGLNELELFLRLSNQAIGDALINILLTEFLLFKLNLSVNEWLSQYDDYPSISTKLYVKNKDIVKTNYEETEIYEPNELKVQVEHVLSKYDNNYRVLVRPSGTEDVVRVHTEGPYQQIVQEIDKAIHEILKNYMEI